MKQQNDAARDLWLQIFERATADLDAALHAPDEEGETAQRELTTYALKEAGWSEDAIRHRDQRQAGCAAQRCRAGACTGHSEIQILTIFVCQRSMLSESVYRRRALCIFH